MPAPRCITCGLGVVSAIGLRPIAGSANDTGSFAAEYMRRGNLPFIRLPDSADGEESADSAQFPCANALTRAQALDFNHCAAFFHRKLL